MPEIQATKDGVLNEILTDLQASGRFKRHRFRPLSFVYTFARALAGAVFRFADSELVSLQKSMHPHTSEEYDLHDWLLRRGLKWRLATRAKHRIRIGSTEAPVQDRDLPQGLIVRTIPPESADPVRFRVLITGTPRLLVGVAQDSRGYYTIEAEAEAELAGSIGNVVADTIVEIEDPPTGFDVVYNPDADPSVEGFDRESIASARARVMLSEQSGANERHTPAWFEAEALAFSSVYRAVHKSTKAIIALDLGREGEVMLLVRGQAGPLSTLQKQELTDHFNSDEVASGAAAHVLIRDLQTVDVDKTVSVQFSQPEYVPDSSVLDAVAEQYFLSLRDGDAFSEADFRSEFFTLQGCVGVVVTPPGDVASGELTIPVPGSGWSLNGVVA